MWCKVLWTVRYLTVSINFNKIMGFKMDMQQNYMFEVTEFVRADPDSFKI